MIEPPDPWIDAVLETLRGHRRMIDGVLAQLTDEELHRRPAPGMNSVAVLLRHLGGNLRSRWTGFLATDGEKPDRDRDREFEDWSGDRASLLAEFDRGWSAFVATLESLTAEDLARRVAIRGEAQPVPQAILRAVAHLAFHAGQIAFIGRLVHEGPWSWLTIPPGGSRAHDAATWGTAASRSVLGGAAPGAAE